jgi:hypothetical protein
LIADELCVDGFEAFDALGDINFGVERKSAAPEPNLESVEWECMSGSPLVHQA